MQIPKELTKRLFPDKILVLDNTRQSKYDFLIQRKRREKIFREGDLDYIKDLISEGYKRKIRERELLLKKKMVELFGTTFYVKEKKVSSILLKFNELEETTGKTLCEIRYEIFRKHGWQKLPFNFKKIIELYGI